MRSLMKGVPRVAAVACATAAIVLFMVIPGGQANAEARSIVLSDLQCEFVFGSPDGQSIYEVSVRVESAATAVQSVEIGFFYTEERTRSHNLIGVATANLIEEGDWVRSGVRWNTAGLNPGLYKLRAVAMNMPREFVENQREDGSYDYVAVILQGAGLVWPPQNARLVLPEEVLCSMDWDRLDGYPTPRATLFDIWNVGSKEITATDTGASQLLVRGEVSLLDEEGAISAVRGFDLSGVPSPVVLNPSILAPGATTPSNAFVRVDLNRFVREAITLYVEREKDRGEVTLRLGDPIPIRTALAFTTSDIEGKAIARSLQSFRAFLPASTDPSISGSQVFSLYTDAEDFIFPRHETCSVSPHAPGSTSAAVLPVSSLEHAGAWNTYVVVEKATGGDEIYLLSRRGQYGGIYGSPIPILARDAGGNPTSTPAKMISGPTIGVGADPGAAFSKKPILFFSGDDGYLRAYMDVGTSFSSVWNTDGWTANAVKVPTGANGAISPPAPLPRPQPNKFAFQQDLTEYVVVGSAQGLYVYRLEYGGTTGQALFRSYPGYNVSTEFAPFAVKRGTSRLVYFFARREGEIATRLWAVDVSTTTPPTSIALLLGGDVPSTELVAARTADLAEALEYLFFGTQEGKVYAVNTTAGTVGRVDAERQLGNRVLGVRAVVRQDGTGYDVYANTEGNRLFQMSATVSGNLLRFATEQAYNPPYSQEYIMGSSLEILPADGTLPGMLFLSYQGGPVVAVDLADPNELLLIDAWADVWTGTATRPTELKPSPFEFFGCALEGCGGFGPPVVARSGGMDRRLLVRAADGTIYAFDLTASILSRRTSNEGTTTPVSP